MIFNLKDETQKAIFEQYKQVRDSGEVNMLDYGRVYTIAVRDDMFALQGFILNHGNEGWGNILKNYSKLVIKFEE